jgi:cytochrome c oxidase cbb3-type subunit III
MYSRFRTDLACGVMAVLLTACAPHESEKSAQPMQRGMMELQGTTQTVITSALAPGQSHPLTTTDPRAAPYYDNADAVAAGKRLYAQFNCSGCHSNGGGGMGPSLMDDVWIYGGRLEQIHQTLVEGRPNGMPTWAGVIPDEQLWQISAYVRSMSLPETLAAQNGPTPSQSPAPVPRSADQDTGWSAPAATTNNFGSTVGGASQ